MELSRDRTAPLVICHHLHIRRNLFQKSKTRTLSHTGSTVFEPIFSRLTTTLQQICHQTRRLHKNLTTGTRETLVGGIWLLRGAPPPSAWAPLPCSDSIFQPPPDSRQQMRRGSVCGPDGGFCPVPKLKSTTNGAKFLVRARGSKQTAKCCDLIQAITREGLSKITPS